MGKTDLELISAKGLTLVGTIGGWLVFLNVLADYLKTGEFLVADYQNLLVISFSFGLIGFISGVETHGRIHYKADSNRGTTSLFAICTFSSAMVIIVCLALIVTNPELLRWLMAKMP